MVNKHNNHHSDSTHRFTHKESVKFTAEQGESQRRKGGEQAQRHIRDVT
jgi:hypothetical protein